MGNSILIWFVITLQPGGDYEAKPYHFERSCQTVAAAYQRINEQTGNGKETFCAQSSPEELARSAGQPSYLR